MVDFFLFQGLFICLSMELGIREGAIALTLMHNQAHFDLKQKIDYYYLWNFYSLKSESFKTGSSLVFQMPYTTAL